MSWLRVWEMEQSSTESADRAPGPRAPGPKQRVEDPGDMAGPGSPPPRRGRAGAGRGGIQAARAAPPSVYLSPGPGAASFSILQAVSPNAPATPLPPAQPPPWLCSRAPVVPTAPFPRSPRLHSPLPPSLQLRPPLLSPPLLLSAAME